MVEPSTPRLNVAISALASPPRLIQAPPQAHRRSIFRRKSWLLTAPYFISTAVKKENDQPRMIGNWPFFSSNVVVELIGLEPTTPCLQNLLRAFSGGHERQ
jgi:hypothetical protein